MLTAIHPKLPMRQRAATWEYYVNLLGFKELGDPNFAPYLMVKKDAIEIHFFEHKTLNPLENDGQVYIRVKGIEAFYQTLLDQNVTIHPNGSLQVKPWGQKEFSLLDPDHNLLTFGEGIE